jgi:hypothetical protein
LSTVTPGPTKAVALADWHGFSRAFHGQSYRVEDYGWALSGRRAIDLYMANQREMNS